MNRIQGKYLRLPTYFFGHTWLTWDDVSFEASVLVKNLFPIYTEILEVNIFAFAYRLFHKDFSPIYETPSVYKNSPSSTLPLVIPE